jgi:formylglycine-generating enzyme required for sulfatase activity
MITSKAFVRQYWGNIERLIAEAFQKRKEPYILQLRIEPSKIDQMRQHIAYEDWGNNADEIAAIIEKKLRIRNRQDIRRCIKWSLLFLVVLIGAGLFLYPNPPPEKPPVEGQNEIQITDCPIKILIKGSDSFFISQTEVTVGQYKRYCDSLHEQLPPQPLHRSLEDYPVVNLTWKEALEFCKSKGGRLPTQAEWEYAALGGKITKYSGGNNAGMVAVYNTYKPTWVATKEQNAYGLYDMTGNVAEWCADSLQKGKKRAVRGGAYNSTINPVNQLAIDYHSSEFPDSARSDIGFRIAWDKNVKN